MLCASVIPAILVALAAAPATAGEPDRCEQCEQCEEPWRVRLTDYLAGYVDELCADASEGACEPLYALLDLVAQPDAVDKGSWCCKTCALQDNPPAVKCEGCAEGGKSMKCGGVLKFADRPVHLDCPGTSIEAGETITCI
ncbi:hypothetical protein [Nannocystis sp. SCPEA4]|uniref:hypothetical protein n=1 Tax=Nannocystis sp. SCPEA4 TaxID=2996787 RepID=UPI0022706E91|nr:hypothetical protein [Nannocystis sp. SCPEA4]MCY1054033.1 hypothetical protein [Nannocystis sp. SCPEA4]